MTLAPAPTRTAPPAGRGRHRCGDDTASVALAELLGDAPRTLGGAHRAAPAPAFSRAARTAGLSLAALGALATAGGVAAHGFDTTDAPAATGELAAGPQLAAADLAVAPPPAAVAAPAVLPAVAAAPAATATATTVSVKSSDASDSKPSTAASTKKKAATSAAKSSGSDEGSSSSEGSSVGAQAVAAAKSKLGKPYVWGSTGPNSFDCSGLTQWAYKQAGKSLPRTSKEQSQFGQKVSLDSLQPGDLVFFYSPVSHEAMYIGDGQIIEAATSGTNVRIRPLSQYKGETVGARRIG